MSTNSSTKWRRRADQLIALIDDAINRQVNIILHHPDFQALEAGWRGLAMLVHVAVRSPDVKIKFLSTSWTELARSMQRASEFDQSHLFELVYNREFGMPGGEPFGLLVGNYQLSPDGPGDAIDTLGDIGTVAASAFCPFVAGASPRVLGLESFHEMNRVIDLSRLTDSLQHIRWNALRTREDSRFIGLVAPRVLMRAPHEPYARYRNDGFPFRETIGPDGSTLLWGNGAFAFATIVIRNFIESGWFADIRGVTQDVVDGGLLSPDELPSYDFGTEGSGLSAQPPVEVRLTDALEQQFCDLGLIPVASAYLSASAIFNSNQSLHAPQHYTNENARQNARLAAMLQYVLCASRFSHYLKVIMRDEIGQLSDAGAIQHKLAEWLSGYTLGNDDADLSLRTRYPLRSASIDVEEISGKPGTFSCTLKLQPHFQLDDLSASFHLIAETAVVQRRSDRAASTSLGVPA
ncbi:type VI secretion system contractile sheath large subunit [Phyllobacterium phragmitis]|uniref:Type VI secretion system contractile sheath large subunit n=1 Tax=Phyllobacterium phragmitis TaxID=2670329 RepID=A0A2S9IKY2_9HYPH|nr:type VI secretion system contractile sheath large subunit [Phyllobacterium phragmitis]PRD41152.1 type VI secretion system contractile sheath large subunit [Phyllobacterium phragmitis]